MKVRYLTCFGRPEGESIMPGDELNVGKDEAQRLIEAGFAEAVASRSAHSAKKASSAKAEKAEKRGE